jgi:hypothetical protein
MNKVVLISLLFFSIKIHCQYNGYIVKSNDTIKVKFKTEDLTVRSFLKIEALQSKVKYELNGETITAKPGDIDGFCIKSNGRDFCFDYMPSENTKDNGPFAFRMIGKKVDRLTVYEFYGSGFIGVNFTSKLAYFVKQRDKKDVLFIATTPKKWRDFLLTIVKDCPIYYQYAEKMIEKIMFEDDFERYLNEYKTRCFK